MRNDDIEDIRQKIERVQSDLIFNFRSEYEINWEDSHFRNHNYSPGRTFEFSATFDLHGSAFHAVTTGIDAVVAEHLLRHKENLACYLAINPIAFISKSKLPQSLYGYWPEKRLELPVELSEPEEDISKIPNSMKGVRIYKLTDDVMNREGKAYLSMQVPNHEGVLFHQLLSAEGLLNLPKYISRLQVTQDEWQQMGDILKRYSHVFSQDGGEAFGTAVVVVNHKDFKPSAKLIEFNAISRNP